MHCLRVDFARVCQIAISFALSIAFLGLPGSITRCAAATPTHPREAPQENLDKDPKIATLGIILKVESLLGGEYILQADGYRVRIRLHGNNLSFHEPLKSIADVAPGSWIRFKGLRDEAGIVNPEQAEFFSPGTRTARTAMGPTKAKKLPDDQPVTRASMIDDKGNLQPYGKKMRMSNFAPPCGWNKVPADAALQERVKRVGMRLVPEYQTQLGRDMPTRIPFRFYAVEDSKTRSPISCSAGLVLVPKNVVERMQNDDQLAAVLADGVAYSLILQQSAFTTSDAVLIGLEGASIYFIGLPFPTSLVEHSQQIQMERKVGRIALQLLEDTGYDPWQAPEAWRLLAPKELPQDVKSLEYTREGKYQLEMLRSQNKPFTEQPGRTGGI